MFPQPPADLLARFQALPAPAADQAAVSLLVLRLAEEGRATPERVLLDPVEGVVGDRWWGGKRDDLAQVTLMRADVAALLVATGGIESFGDNLFAALDTSVSNLPPGTLLRVGGARCEVTPKPHRGCVKFARRSVPGARDLLDHPDLLPLQLRGVHLRVLARGEVQLGDPIQVELRS